MIESIAKHPYAPRQTTRKNLEADEKTLQSCCLFFRGRRVGELIPTFHEVSSVKQDRDATSATTS